MDVDHIRQRLEVIEKLRADVKIAKDMLSDALENDATYGEAAEEAKVAVNKKNQARDSVYNKPDIKQTITEMKDNNQEIATIKEILSEELIEYRQHSHTESIEDKNGNVHYFKFAVKLSKRQGDLDKQAE